MHVVTTRILQWPYNPLQAAGNRGGLVGFGLVVVFLAFFSWDEGICVKDV